ncbi:MAG: Glycosyl transferase group 1 [Candidatus Daviesbacteria bacterium GW2011_GWA1_41_61]|uniref:Glycosyl transferase group 1 n=1 Tax=Candidatus Daviesbacteria bacterium GW2011_GWA2_40_9 TaxID=1618424 RepID=A0A0G0U8R3_9BACT|nr:MAG: Glycosyl transferase group 1 [Candidatus Daviesbacteria bacterium GW2011_GWA2_40_9]KKR92731.1 MAG: Glycosyl transferase group 1 [Candidatus Daviesbacteria bacterium GW2011_GWB1_41_15]KKS14661.1 MAG: Glycosyl transferase group 1 [Candidatus Daviesbacteria bacterium GW2011_GWA1_41_61]
MNIGFDASRSFIGKRTGTENYSYQVLKHLAQLDHTNNYYIYLRPGAGLALQGQTLQDWPVNFKFIIIPYPRLWTQFGLALQTFKDPLDILFIPAHTLPLIRKPGLKTVVTVHDLGAEYLPQTHQIKQRLYLSLMTHHQLKSATHLIAVSESTKKDLIAKIKIPEKKISVIYEGFNQELFALVKDDVLNNVLREYDLVKNSYLLFVGTIQPRKNLERLIRAYKGYLVGGAQERSQVSTASRRTSGEDAPEIPKRQDPQVKSLNLVLAGSKGWLSDEIYQLPTKLGIEDDVKFLGYVPDKHLPALYSGAKAFLYPSLFEGFGLPILEAFSCGCPVLTSTTSSTPEVAGDAAILVNPYSVDDITRGIKQITNDEKLTNQLVAKGFEQVKKFSWEKAAKETLQILIDTVKNS